MCIIFRSRRLFIRIELGRKGREMIMTYLKVPVLEHKLILKKQLRTKTASSVMPWVFECDTCGIQFCLTSTEQRQCMLIRITQLGTSVLVQSERQMHGLFQHREKVRCCWRQACDSGDHCGDERKGNKYVHRCPGSKFVQSVDSVSSCSDWHFFYVWTAISFSWF